MEVKCNYDKLKQAVTQIVVKTGMPLDQSALLADLLTVTEAKGVYSHGVGLLKRYVEELLEGYVNLHPNIAILRDTPACLMVDGDNGMGVVVAARAMEIAMERARKQGCATVLVKHANHFGAGLYYAGMATANNQIAYLYANANPSMPPWGGAAKLLGTNPYVFGAPAGKYAPYILDMATTAAAYNKILHASLAGKPIPESWGYDADGKPCTDPQRVLNGGSLQPFGGIKGYGIAGMVDIVAGVLTGAAFGYDVRVAPNGPDAPTDFGYMIQVIDIASIMDVGLYTQRMEKFIEMIKNAPRAEGVDAIHYPGDLEGERIARARKEGVALSEVSFAALRDAATSVGLDINALLR